MTLGRMLVALGVVLVIAGLIFEFAPALRPGRLPGDLSFSSGNVRVYVPLGTSLVLSIVLTLVLWFLSRR